MVLVVETATWLRSGASGLEREWGHVFYLATNDAKTKHSAATKKKLTPVDQQGGGWCLTCAF